MRQPAAGARRRRRGIGLERVGVLDVNGTHGT
jgi:hypothetical protein